jgi:hypothetical protein
MGLSHELGFLRGGVRGLIGLSAGAAGMTDGMNAAIIEVRRGTCARRRRRKTLEIQAFQR